MHPKIIYDYFGIQKSDTNWLWAPTHSERCSDLALMCSLAQVQIQNSVFVIEVHFENVVSIISPDSFVWL